MGTFALEFATGALTMVSAAAAKKTVLDPLTAKLKNMSQKEAMEKLSKEEIAEVVTEGRQVIEKQQPKVKEEPKAEPTPAPKKPEVDPIDASIKALQEILPEARMGGKGARVTREAKTHFRAVAQEFFTDITDLLKTKNTDTANKILSRIDKYIEFDRIISKKDYAQGSELVANQRNAMDFEFQNGISAAGITHRRPYSS